MHLNRLTLPILCLVLAMMCERARSAQVGIASDSSLDPAIKQGWASYKSTVARLKAVSTVADTRRTKGVARANESLIKAYVRAQLRAERSKKKELAESILQEKIKLATLFGITLDLSVDPLGLDKGGVDPDRYYIGMVGRYSLIGGGSPPVVHLSRPNGKVMSTTARQRMSNWRADGARVYNFSALGWLVIPKGGRFTIRTGGGSGVRLNAVAVAMGGHRFRPHTTINLEAGVYPLSFVVGHNGEYVPGARFEIRNEQTKQIVPCIFRERDLRDLVKPDANGHTIHEVTGWTRNATSIKLAAKYHEAIKGRNLEAAAAGKEKEKADAAAQANTLIGGSPASQPDSDTGVDDPTIKRARETHQKTVERFDKQRRQAQKHEAKPIVAANTQLLGTYDKAREQATAAGDAVKATAIGDAHKALTAMMGDDQSDIVTQDVNDSKASD